MLKSCKAQFVGQTTTTTVRVLARSRMWHCRVAWVLPYLTLGKIGLHLAALTTTAVSGTELKKFKIPNGAFFRNVLIMTHKRGPALPVNPILHV